MRVSREQVAENRQKILDAAGRLFRARGFEAVTVAEVMKAAGLTHGGFYGYFASKDELVAAALADVFGQAGEQAVEIGNLARRYLSRAHRDDPAHGCPVAALGAEAARQTAPARRAMTDGVERQIERLCAGDTSAAARRAAVGSWAAMVGGIVLARLADDPELSDEVLELTREWVEGKVADTR